MTTGSMTTATDKDSFVKAVLARFAARGWMDKLDYRADTFSIDLGKGGTAFLDHLYQDWQHAEDDAGRDRVVNALVTMAFDTVKRGEASGFDDVKADILPAIRNREYIDDLWMTMPSLGKDLVQNAERPFCDSMTIVLTVNAAASIGSVFKPQLTDWGKSFDDVMTTAMSNLRTFKKADFQKHDDGFFFLNSEDYYDPSALLLPEFFANLTVKGDPVAVAVSRTLLLVAGSQDMAALKAMADLAEQTFNEDSRPISLAPIILRSGSWQPFAPVAGSYPMVDRLRTINALRNYGSQLQAVNSYNKSVDREVYVGQLEAIEIEHGLMTWASLADGIETWLPVCDAVIMAPADLKNPFVRRFEDVLAVCGDVATVPDTWPPLYIFKTGLSHEQSESLRKSYKPPEGFPEIGKPT